MASLHVLKDSTQRLLAKSRTATKLAVKIRNQANFVIGYHLGESINWHQNGEFKLIEHLSPHVRTFIDVGANVGEWSEYMLKHSHSKGYLFEPSQQCVRALKERFRHSDVVIRDAAVSDKIGTARFGEEDNCGEASSLLEIGSEIEAFHYRDVPVTTLDTDLAPLDLRVDFLKIDAEGYDLKVMKGATNLLSRTRFLQFEYNSKWLPVGSSLRGDLLSKQSWVFDFSRAEHRLTPVALRILEGLLQVLQLLCRPFCGYGCCTPSPARSTLSKLVTGLSRPPSASSCPWIRLSA